jgi:ABC-2 type transport system permease protein
MTDTARPTDPSPISRPPDGAHAVGAATRSPRHDVGTIPLVLRSEWIKLSTLRSTKVIVTLAIALNAVAAWASAVLVTDEVLTVAQVFVFPAVFTAVLAAVAGILLFTSDAQHGTLALALTARPSRWVIAASKAVLAATVGLALGAAGLAAAFLGGLAGGLALGDTTAIPRTAACALFYSSAAALIGLGIGMCTRHSAAAISGLLVWWFVVENLVRTFAPVTVGRLLPFDAGYRLLGVGSNFDTPEILAAAFPKPQLALVFGTYAVVALLAGTALLQRRDTN